MKMALKSDSSSLYGQLPSLFFETRQIIRQTLPAQKQSDPNEWMRLQTIHFIDRSQEPTMQDVATYLRIKAPSATSLISYLVTHGLIQRDIGKDRRSVRLSVTPAGKQALKRYGEQSAKMMKRAFSTLDEKEVWSLCSILKKIINSHSGTTQ